MNLISSLMELLISNTFSIIIIFILWKISSFFMIKVHLYYLVYYTIRMSIVFFFFPVIKIIQLFKYYVSAGTWFAYSSIFDFLSYKIVNILFLMWLAGVLLKSCYLVRPYIKLTKIEKHNEEINTYDETLMPIKRHLNYKRDVNVYQNFLFPSPAAVGVFHKRMILPERTFRKDEMDLILYHEILHLKNRDIEVKCIFNILSCIYWFIPLEYFYIKEYNLWSEVICDYNVYKATGDRFDKLHYIMLIINITTLFSAEIFKCKPSQSIAYFSKGKSNLKRRIKYMGNFKMKTSKKLAMVLSLVFFSLSGLTAFAATSGIDAYLNRHSNFNEYEEGGKKDQNTLEEQAAALDEQNLQVIEMPSDKSKSGGYLAWSDPANTIYTTSRFTASSGQIININGIVTTSGKTARFGILCPEGKKRYVVASDVDHDFEIDTTGTYRVFVENINSTAINVEFTYICK